MAHCPVLTPIIGFVDVCVYAKALLKKASIANNIIRLFVLKICAFFISMIFFVFVEFKFVSFRVVTDKFLSFSLPLFV